MNPSPEQSTETNTQAQALVETRSFRYGFRIAELGFLIPQGSAHATLIENAVCFPIPNTVFWLKGLINNRGNLVPVFDLGSMLGSPLKPKKNAMMVFTIRKRSVAFNIDSGHSIEESNLQTIESSVPAAYQTYTQKTYQADQIIWIEFDFVKCLKHYENQISI